MKELVVFTLGLVQFNTPEAAIAITDYQPQIYFVAKEDCLKFAADKSAGKDTRLLCWESKIYIKKEN